MSNQTYLLSFLAATILIMSSACNFSQPEKSAVTLTPIPVTPAPTATSKPPTILIGNEMDCYGGPGGEYGLIATFESGEEVRVVGKDDYGEYWVVIDPKSLKGCWIGRRNTTAQGETDYLLNLVPPPTPPATAPAAPENFRLVQESCTILKTQRPILWEIVVVLAWEDMANNEDIYRLTRNGVPVEYPEKDSTEYRETFRVKADDNSDVRYMIEAINYEGGVSEAREITVSYTCE